MQASKTLTRASELATERSPVTPHWLCRLFRRLSEMSEGGARVVVGVKEKNIQTLRGTPGAIFSTGGWAQEGGSGSTEASMGASMGASMRLFHFYIHTLWTTK